MKELKINIPKGYEIDKENSTFECIKFKKITETIIKWDAELFGVEIQDECNHFVLSGQPSMVMSWYDAVRFYKDNKVWQLPSRKHLELIVKHLDEVNTLIKANGGYEIRGWLWTAEEYDEFCACFVDMSSGLTSNYRKRSNLYVRAVSAFQN